MSSAFDPSPRGAVSRSSSSENILPQDTLTNEQSEPGFDPPTGLLGNPLYQLSRSRCYASVFL